MIKDKNKQIIDITHCPLFCDILSHKSIIEKQEIYENNYYDLQLASYELEKYRKLEDELGCPLDLVLIPYFISGLKKVWYHNQWCDVVRIVAYEEATTPYMEVRCKDYDYLKFIPLTNYKKTFWLKEDKSE